MQAEQCSAPPAPDCAHVRLRERERMACMTRRDGVRDAKVC